MSQLPPLLAAIEAGGTKYVCAVADDPSKPEAIYAETRFPTREPVDTLAEAVSYFKKASTDLDRPIAAMGIGTFGPAELDTSSDVYGSILKTPKEHWSGFNIVSALRDGLGNDFPILYETDVNAAAVGEAEYGAAVGIKHVAYVTVGTGIGAGFLENGTPIHGRMHTEVGHFIVPNLDHEYEGVNNVNVCPFHECCLEGRASGTAIKAHWDKPGHELPEDHPAWDLEARYLALGAVNMTAAWSPDTIIYGGGVFQHPRLINMVREHFETLAGDYWSLPDIERYIQTPALEQQAGIVGSLCLARRALG